MADFTLEAEILWLGHAVSEEKAAKGEEPIFTIAEIQEKRKSMSLADHVRVQEIARRLEQDA